MLPQAASVTDKAMVKSTLVQQSIAPMGLSKSRRLQYRPQSGIILTRGTPIKGCMESPDFGFRLASQAPEAETS